MESSAENSLAMVGQSDKNITKMMEDSRKRNGSKAGARTCQGQSIMLVYERRIKRQSLK